MAYGRESVDGLCGGILESEWKSARCESVER